MTYDEILEMKLSPYNLEQKMNEAFEITVVDLLYAKGYEEQGCVWIEESAYSFIWDIFDMLNQYNPDLPTEKLKTDYVFLPETLEVVRENEC